MTILPVFIVDGEIYSSIKEDVHMKKAVLVNASAHDVQDRGMAEKNKKEFIAERIKKQ